MDTFIRIALAGFSNAALYALIAFSVVLVYRGSGVKNFGVGHLAMFGGLFFTQWNGGAGGWLALGLAFAVSMVTGVLCYFVAVRPAERRGAPQLTLAISTLGFGLVLYFIAGWVWEKRGFTVPPLIEGSVRIMEVNVTYQRILLVLTTVALLATLIIFIERTMVGWALESVAFDQSIAGLYGVNVTRIMVLTWALAGGVAGLAGSLLAGVSSISRDVALALAVKGIAAAVLGGLGSLPGAIVGALLVAFGEALFVNFVSSVWANAFVFILLFSALSVRPQGVFGLPRQVERT